MIYIVEEAFYINIDNKVQILYLYHSVTLRKCVFC